MNTAEILSHIRKRPHAVAVVNGSRDYPDIRGTVSFYQTGVGVLVSVQMTGLPRAESACRVPIFAMHIHSGGSCTGNESDPFADALTHYNPRGCPHPYHAGDMPPLFGANGRAFCAFLTNRFTVAEVIGRCVIVHGSRDDFTTQPSGDAGTKIACGVIRRGR